MSDFMDRVRRYASYMDDDAAQAMIALAEAGIADIRTLNCAANNGVRSLEDFTKYTERELLRWGNFGRRSLNLVKEAIHAEGLALNGGDMGDSLLRELLAMAEETRQCLRKAGEDHKAALAAIEVRRGQLIKSRESA